MTEVQEFHKSGQRTYISERSNTRLFESLGDVEENIRINDFEADLIVRKIREEELIKIPYVPKFMVGPILNQSLKLIIEKTPLYLSDDIFNGLMSGDSDLDDLEESIILQLNEDLYIPFLSREGQRDLVEKLCSIYFSPKSFRTAKRQALSRSARDFFNDESRKKIATELNELVDVPFFSEDQEQKAAEKIVDTVYATLQKVLPRTLLDALDSTSPEEIREIRTNLIDRLAEKIQVPLMSEEQEKKVVQTIVDGFLSYWGLEKGAKTLKEQMGDTQHRLRQVDIELEALRKTSQSRIQDLMENQQRLKEKVSTLANQVFPSPTPVDNVLVLEDAEAVGDKIRQIVAEEAERAIKERGHFALAIPGGSILKMLAGEIPNKESWTPKTTLVYVNHKCVDMDDAELATHAKARKLFLDEWKGVNTIMLGGTCDGEKEAKAYEDKMKALDQDLLPIEPESGLPIFDLSLIGVGGKYFAKCQYLNTTLNVFDFFTRTNTYSSIVDC